MKEKKTGSKNLICRLTSVKGMADILPGEIVYWRYLENLAGEFFPFFGYKEIRLPLLEKTELFSRSIGEDTEIVNKEMYTIREKDGENVSLRPEATASVVRAFLEHNLFLGGDIKKFFYAGPMFRRERPQSGRMRQFHQLGVEVIGNGDATLIDADVIHLADKFLKKAGIMDFDIQINHLGCSECRKKYIKILKEYFNTTIRALCPDCQRRFDTNVLRILDCKKDNCRVLIKGAPKITDSLCEKCLEHLLQVEGILKLTDTKFSLNPHLVRGLDYYTGIVFEIIHPGLGAQNALGAGGRYDNLIEQFGGPSLPATGFSFGLERLIISLKKSEVQVQEENKTEIILIVLGKDNLRKSLEVRQRLWQEGFRVEISYDENKSLKAQLRLADKLKIKFVLILGEEEKVKGSIQVKNMETGKQGMIKIEDLINYLGEKRV